MNVFSIGSVLDDSIALCYHHTLGLMHLFVGNSIFALSNWYAAFGTWYYITIVRENTAITVYYATAGSTTLTRLATFDGGPNGYMGQQTGLRIGSTVTDNNKLAFNLHFAYTSYPAKMRVVDFRIVRGKAVVPNSVPTDAVGINLL